MERDRGATCSNGLRLDLNPGLCSKDSALYTGGTTPPEEIIFMKVKSSLSRNVERLLL